MTDDGSKAEVAGQRAAEPAPPLGGEDGQLEAGETADLLSIGLLVFFVALLLIVAALLALPLVLG